MPPDSAYAETCASVAFIFFAARMAKLERKGAYYDEAERALYNTVLAGMSMDGREFFYVNPLEVVPQNCAAHTSMAHVKPVRQKWFGCACCPPNVARLLASLGKYVIDADGGTVFINLFASCGVAVDVGGEVVNVKIETRFPRENVVNITVDKDAMVAVRMPYYAERFGMSVGYEVKNGYAYFTAKANETIRVTFDAPPRFVFPNPLVSQLAGQVCVMRGPMVYCFEQADNGENLAAFRADATAPIDESWNDELNAVTLKVRGCKRVSVGGLYVGVRPAETPAVFTAVPYAFWGNRTKGEMRAWVLE